METNRRIQINLQLTDEQHKELRLQSANIGVSLTKLVNHLVVNSLKKTKAPESTVSTHPYTTGLEISHDIPAPDKPIQAHPGSPTTTRSSKYFTDSNFKDIQIVYDNDIR